MGMESCPSIALSHCALPLSAKPVSPKVLVFSDPLFSLTPSFLPTVVVKCVLVASPGFVKVSLQL